jgi:hypothetical protein
VRRRLRREAVQAGVPPQDSDKGGPAWAGSWKAEADRLFGRAGSVRRREGPRDHRPLSACLSPDGRPAVQGPRRDACRLHRTPHARHRQRDP